MPSSSDIARSVVITVERKYTPLFEELTKRIDELEKTVTTFKNASAPVLSEGDRRLFVALKQERARLAALTRVPAYCIVRDIALAELVRLKPKTLAEVRSLRGFGLTSTEKYGWDFLRILAMCR
jgi:superfamily II DNA helicase RecQ